MAQQKDDNIEERIKELSELKEHAENLIIEHFPQLHDSLKYNEKIRLSLMNESDRSVSLIAVSYLESHLEKVLKLRLLGGNAHLKKCFGFNGPFGTFSSKIDIALCLGIINKAIYNEINIFRKIRNIFAHSYDDISFDNNPVDALINKLELSPRDDRKTCSNRQNFLSTLFFLLGLLQSYNINPTTFKEEESLKNLDNHLKKLRSQNYYSRYNYK